MGQDKRSWGSCEPFSLPWNCSTEEARATRAVPGSGLPVRSSPEEARETRAVPGLSVSVAS